MNISSVKAPSQPPLNRAQSPEETQLATDINAVDIREDIDILAATPRVAKSAEYLEAAKKVVTGALQAGWDASIVQAGSQKWNNIVAERKGTAPDGERGLVILGAHLDSVRRAPGGNDNASGSAAMLDIARAISALPPTRNDIRILWFDGEEGGLLGSRAYAKEMTEVDRKRTIGMLNADMIGSPYSKTVGYSLAPRTTNGLGTVIREVAERNNIPSTLYSERHSRSDHASFDAIGIPAVEFGVSVKTIGKEDPNYHSSKDTKDNINSTILEGYADLVGLTAWDLANRDSIPKGIAPDPDTEIIHGPPK